MNTPCLRRLLATALPLVLMTINVNSSQATVFEHIDNSPTDPAAALQSIQGTYNDVTEMFTWDFSVGKFASGELPNGFWLTVSDGANPTGHPNEYAILYGDRAASLITAYVYNGLPAPAGDNSWQTPGEHIQSFVGELNSSDDGNVVNMNFGIDVSLINNYLPTNPGTNDWAGVRFGPDFGVWFHVTYLDNVAYDQNGLLTTWDYDITKHRGSYDGGFPPVPEPASIALLAIGCAGLGLLRRSQSTKFQ